MADLLTRGFTPSTVSATRMNIHYDDPFGLGPFCRLAVTTTAPLSPGVYAWTAEDVVSYVGMASFLAHVVHGAKMQRAYNDYTYIPKSKVATQPHSPRVRVNGLLNRAIADGLVVTWWWLTTDSVEDAKTTEARLIAEWQPPWNRAHPTVV